jgi:hypothetical protein
MFVNCNHNGGSFSGILFERENYGEGLSFLEMIIGGYLWREVMGIKSKKIRKEKV